MSESLSVLLKRVAPYFAITDRTALSFSGGRTSAFMLWLVIQSNPPEVLREHLRVMFGNTGREDEATLVFIKRCTDAWLAPLGMAMTWVECPHTAAWQAASAAPAPSAGCLL